MKPGTRYGDLPKHLRRYRDDIFDDKYNRLSWDDVSRSITAHIAKDGYWYIHPSEQRTLTVREAARIQTFPDHFRFAGTRSHAFRQIGNAVPVALAEAIGRQIAALFEDASAGSRSAPHADSPRFVRPSSSGEPATRRRRLGAIRASLGRYWRVFALATGMARATKWSRPSLGDFLRRRVLRSRGDRQGSEQAAVGNSSRFTPCSRAHRARHRRMTNEVGRMTRGRRPHRLGPSDEAIVRAIGLE